MPIFQVIATNLIMVLLLVNCGQAVPNDGEDPVDQAASQVTEQVSSYTSPINKASAVTWGDKNTFAINGGATFGDSRTVHLSFMALANTVVMKIAENPQFTGVTWQRYMNELDYVFGGEGLHTIYVQFAGSDQKGTGILQAQILVDLFAEGDVPFAGDQLLVLEQNLVDASVGAVTTKMTIPSKAVIMRIGLDPQFTGIVWEEAVPQRVLTIPNAAQHCGDQMIYLQFQDKDGFNSPIVKQPFRIVCAAAADTGNTPTAN